MDNKTYEEDFKMIRSAIDGAKNPMNQLGGFFKSYAIINMITVVLYLIVSLYQGFVREMYIGRMICFVYLAYYIFRMYKEEKSNTNHYYQAMLYIYGSVVVVIPVILWIAGIIGSFTLNNEASQAGKMLEMLMNLQDMLQGERISNTGSILFKTQTTDHQSSDHKKIAFYRTKEINKCIGR